MSKYLEAVVAVESRGLEGFGLAAALAGDEVAYVLVLAHLRRQFRASIANHSATASADMDRYVDAMLAAHLPMVAMAMEKS